MDNVKFNTRERPLTQDHNDAQTMLTRVLADVLGYSGMSDFPMTGVSAPGVSTFENYVAGMRVYTEASNLTQVKVSAGMLVQYSTSLSPTPGTYDSPYRIGFLRTPLAVALPAPGANTFYLLEAQVSEVLVSSELRDVLNATTGIFDATNVPKKYENRITTQWKAGSASAFPAPTGGDWVVLGGVYVLTGGAVSGFPGSDCVDIRPFVGYRDANRYNPGKRPTVSKLDVTESNPSVATKSIGICVDEAISSQPSSSSSGGGVKMRLVPLTTSHWPNVESDISESGLVYTETTWYYLYLCPWNGLAPEFLNSHVVGRGVPVISVNPPDANGMNASAITLGGVYSGTVAVGTSPCIGAIHRDGNANIPGFGNTGWTTMRGAHGEISFPPFNAYLAANTAAAAASKTVSVPYSKSGAYPGLPKCARSVRVLVEVAQTSTANDGYFLITAKRAAGGNWDSRVVYSPETYGDSMQVVLTVPVTTDGFDVVIQPFGTASLVGNVTISIIGYSM